LWVLLIFRIYIAPHISSTAKKIKAKGNTIRQYFPHVEYEVGENQRDREEKKGIFAKIGVRRVEVGLETGHGGNAITKFFSAPIPAF